MAFFNAEYGEIFHSFNMRCTAGIFTMKSQNMFLGARRSSRRVTLVVLYVPFLLKASALSIHIFSMLVGVGLGSCLFAGRDRQGDPEGAAKRN